MSEEIKYGISNCSEFYGKTNDDIKYIFEHLNQDSCYTVRKNLDKNAFVCSWIGDCVLDEYSIAYTQYTYGEIMSILSGSEWNINI